MLKIVEAKILPWGTPALGKWIRERESSHNEQQRIDLIRLIWLLEIRGPEETEFCGGDLPVRRG